LDSPSLNKFYMELLVAPWFRAKNEPWSPNLDRSGCQRRSSVAPWGRLRPAKEAFHPAALLEPHCLTQPRVAQPIEPILFPKLRIRLAEFPYATLFYAPETAHLGDLMRIRYG